jgi:hypothetical protein
MTRMKESLLFVLLRCRGRVDNYNRGLRRMTGVKRQDHLGHALWGDGDNEYLDHWTIMITRIMFREYWDEILRPALLVLS